MNMPKFNMNWIYFVAILTLAMLYMTSSGDGIGASQAHTEASYTDFKAFVERGYADKIVVNKNQNTLKMYVKAEHIRDIFKQGHQQTGTSPYVDVEIGSVDQVEQFLDKMREEKKFTGKLSYENKREGGGFFGDLFYSLLPLLIIIGLWMLLFRRMDIGTGKDLGDYTLNIKHETLNIKDETLNIKDETLNIKHETLKIPYHLIDICEPGTKYNLFQYQQDFYDAYQDIRSRGVTPILCGGTGLYIEAVLKGYHLSPVPQNPALRQQLEGKSLDELTQMLVALKAKSGSTMHNKTDVDSCQRAIRAIEIETYNLENPVPLRELPPVPSLIIGVNIDRDLRREKITRRLKARLDEGMVDEVRGLLNEGIPAEDLIYYGLEYKYVTEYITGVTNYDEMFQRLEIAIHQFAKRQMTWFRGMERRGFTIHWIDATLPMEEKITRIIELWQ